ncbi:MAG: glycosyltransferase family 4 protein [DPANN group archaeon]|nr:glycosyltransferase family 4 protein [DPANN group archaeon]
MRIAFLAPEFYHAWGGVGSYSLALIRGLMALPGLEIHVITPDVQDEQRKASVDQMFNKQVHIHTISLAKDTFVYNLKFQTALWSGFRRLHRTFGFDLVHAANLVHMPDIFLKFKKADIPSIVTVHTTIRGQVSGSLLSRTPFFRMAPSERLSLLAYPYIRLMERHYMKKTDAAIAVSSRYQTILRKDYGFRGPVKVIHNSIDLAAYRKRRWTQGRCERLFPALHDRKKTTVLFAGRLIALKGIDILMRAIAELEATGTHYTYLLAGRGDSRFLSELRHRHGADHADIRYLGHVDNSLLPALYASADLFVLPSFTENLPITLMEAQASGCVPIASDVGSVDEIIDDGSDGILVQPGHHLQLAAAIRLLGEDSSLRERLAREGRRNARRFDVKDMARKTHAFYEKILAAHPSRSKKKAGSRNKADRRRRP